MVLEKATIWKGKSIMAGSAQSGKSSSDQSEKSSSKNGGYLKLVILIVIPLLLIMGLTAHEMSVRYLQDYTCTVCHEMRAPIEKWRSSGTDKNHNNCAGCHFDKGFDGWMAMNKSALRFLIVHFERDPNEPIQPKTEPLFLEEGKEPGYWSHVPNHRCYQCHEAKNHKPIDQARIHKKLIKNISAQPCKDCHNHEMRNGQKFYEKVTEEKQAGS